MRMACILIGSYYVLCIPHILMASRYQGVLPLRGGASLSLIMVSSCHAIDVETEAHTYKTEHDDQEQCLVQVSKPLYLGGSLVYLAHLGKLPSGSHVSLIAFLVFGVVLVGHLLPNEHLLKSFCVHRYFFFIFLLLYPFTFNSCSSSSGQYPC